MQWLPKRALFLFTCFLLGCSHLDPYEAPTAAEGATSRKPYQTVFEPGKSSSEAGIAEAVRASGNEPHMYAAMLRTDEQRVRLLEIVRHIGGERDFYDAALWMTLPLAAFQPQAKDIRRAAAVLGAGYGYLSMQPKERVPMYLAGVKELTCLMASYSRFLYPRSDIDRLYGQELTRKETRRAGTAGEVTTIWSSSEISERKEVQEAEGAWEVVRVVERRESRLAQAIVAFQKKTIALQSVVAITPDKTTLATCAGDSHTYECEQKRKILQKPIPGNRKDWVEFLAYGQAQMEKAAQVRRQLDTVVDSIRSEAPSQLNLRTQLVLGNLGKELDGIRPAPKSFAAALDALEKEVKESVAKGIAVGQSTSRPSSSTQPRLPILMLNDSRGISARTDVELARLELELAMEAAQGFIEVHEARRKNAIEIDRLCGGGGQSQSGGSLSSASLASSTETALPLKP